MTTLATTETHDLVPRSAAPNTAMVEVAQSRAAQEVQAAMIIAKRCPRDEQIAFDRIIQSCRRLSLAEQSQYTYDRGGTTVNGPSIRLAETLARAWGNIDSGIVEVEQRNGESVMQAYCWDLETNTRAVKIFTVPHERHTRSGVKKLTDPRDIYEMTANQGARRLRACILGIIPGDIVEAAMAECDKTMAGNNTEPLADRIRKMVGAFGSKGVTADMIERRLGHKLDVTSEAELVNLRKIYTSITDNMAAVEQFFPPTGAPVDPNISKTDNLAANLAAGKAAKEKEAAKKPAQEAPAPKVDPDAQPEPTVTLTPEILVDALAKKNGVSLDIASESLVEHCRGIGKRMGKMKPDELADLAKAIEAGEVKIES